MNKQVFLITLFFLCPLLPVIGQSQPDYLGFTHKAEALNVTVNNLKVGKWIEYMDSAGYFTKDTDAPFYCLTIYRAGKPFGRSRAFYKDGQLRHLEPFIEGK